MDLLEVKGERTKEGYTTSKVGNNQNLVVCAVKYTQQAAVSIMHVDHRIIANCKFA